MTNGYRISHPANITGLRAGVARKGGLETNNEDETVYVVLMLLSKLIHY